MKPKETKDLEIEKGNKRNLEEIEQPKKARKLTKDKEIDKFKPRVMERLKEHEIKKKKNSKLKKIKKIKAREIESTGIDNEIKTKKARLQKVIEIKIKRAHEIEIETKLTKTIEMKLKKLKELIKKSNGEANLITKMNESKSIILKDAELKQNVSKIKKDNIKCNSKETKPNLQKKNEILSSKNQPKKSISKSKQSMDVIENRSFKEIGIQNLEIKLNEKVPVIIKTKRLNVKKMNNVPKSLIIKTLEFPLSSRCVDGVCRKYKTSLLSFKQNKFLEKKSSSYHKSNKQNKNDQYTDISVKQSKVRM